MNYNFTDRVRKVLAMAREEAIRLQHDYVGTEHILLGLIREGEGVAAAVLNNLAVDLEKVEDESPCRGKTTIVLGELPYTSRAREVLEFAMAEARELNHSCVGTEHLLLALRREREASAPPRSHRPVPSSGPRWPHRKRIPRKSKGRALAYESVRAACGRKSRPGSAASGRSVCPSDSERPRVQGPELSRWMVFCLQFLRALGPQHAMILLSAALVIHPPALDAPTVATIATSVWTSVKLKRQGGGAARPDQQQVADNPAARRGETE